MDGLSPLEKHDRDLDAHSGGKSDFLAHAAGIAAVGLTVIACAALTYFSHFTFGFFKVLFGVFTGILVKHIGRGSGRRYGVLAGAYAVVAVIGYEMILSAFFYDPAVSAMSRHGDDEMQALREQAHSYRELLFAAASAVGAFVLAYRIGKNPMKKDELDYLLEAKLGADAETKYAGNYFKKKRRR
jgi:hypothetical protein